MRASVSDLREPLLVLPAKLVEMLDVAYCLGPAPREEALDVVPVGLLAVEHGRLHHHGQSQLTLESVQQVPVQILLCVMKSKLFSMYRVTHQVGPNLPLTSKQVSVSV